jgi:hypothetical protein
LEFGRCLLVDERLEYGVDRGEVPRTVDNEESLQAFGIERLYHRCHYRLLIQVFRELTAHTVANLVNFQYGFDVVDALHIEVHREVLHVEHHVALIDLLSKMLARVLHSAGIERRKHVIPHSILSSQTFTMTLTA